MGLLDDKVILVTGGSSGIGKSSAEIIGKEGAIVVVADVQDEAGELTVSKITKNGGKAFYKRVDVTDFGGVKKAIDDLVVEHGRIDGAFNNAGIEGPTAKISDYANSDWAKVIDVNLTGVYNCMRCQIDQMLTQSNGGSIVNTSSAAGLIGIPGATGYNSAKHGVVGLTKTVALEYAAKNIRVNAVCPGFIETPMLERVTDASVKIREQLIKMVPMKRVAKPSEIGDAVAWLLSQKSSYVTGVALPVDGGWVAQ
ncbi:MAG: glucose 1-dehydrogenase [Pseudomonadota bacterium]|nr:glucose 1-dehydrogenase [Pseudomonadota bacterium]